jgi:hypothetical protein
VDKSHQRIIRETVGTNPMFSPELIMNPATEILNGFKFGRIPFKTAKKFIEKYEWLGYIGRGRICYGLYKEDLLYGVEVFCPLPFLAARSLGTELSSKSLYLSRGACCLDAGKNSGSMLIAACLRDLRKNGYYLIVAYSDTDAGEQGIVYKSANATYFGNTTSIGTIYAEINGKQYSPKSLFNKFGVSDYRKLDKDVRVSGTRKDKTNKKRFAWVLRRSVKKQLPKSWFQIAEEVSREIRNDSIVEGGVRIPDFA